MLVALNSTQLNSTTSIYVWPKVAQSLRIFVKDIPPLVPKYGIVSQG